MAKESKKNDVPACACGKVDLYGEWLKQQSIKEEISDAAKINQADGDFNANDNTDDKKKIRF